MPLAVLRTRKIKNAKDLTLAHQHNERTRDTPNADPARLHLNQVLAGVRETPLAEAVAQRIEAAQPGKKVRSNAVLALDFILSASPDYFAPAAHVGRNKPASYGGRFDKSKTDEWVQASMGFLRTKYGAENLVRVVLHLDETTPHIHAQVVPIDQLGRLNARGVIGGSKNVLRDLQTEYAGWVKHLGIERGVEGARATHTALDEVYSAVNAPDKPLTAKRTQTLEVVVERRKLMPDVIEERQVIDPTHYREMVDRLKQSELKGKTLAQVKRENAQLKRANGQLSGKALQDKVETLRLRTIPAREVLAKLYQVRSTDEAELRVKGVQVLLGEDGRHRVGGLKGKLSGSAIDLVCALEGWESNGENAKKSVELLATAFGADACAQAYAATVVPRLVELGFRLATEAHERLAHEKKLRLKLQGGQTLAG